MCCEQRTGRTEVPCGSRPQEGFRAPLGLHPQLTAQKEARPESRPPAAGQGAAVGLGCWGLVKRLHCSCGDAETRGHRAVGGL